jgi:hypothetical protein
LEQRAQLALVDIDGEPPRDLVAVADRQEGGDQIGWCSRVLPLVNECSGRRAPQCVSEIGSGSRDVGDVAVGHAQHHVALVVVDPDGKHLGRCLRAFEGPEGFG